MSKKNSQESFVSKQPNVGIHFTSQKTNPPVKSPIYPALDFTRAAKISTPTVVHVMTTTIPGYSNRILPNPFRQFFGDDFFDRYFGYPREPLRSSGSGVIISSDGYIITNNHVINGADEIKVVLYDKEEYQATVVGKDPSTDLALLKINATGLPYIEFGNSDSVEVGQWVLAVGNPFNLASTVTAGIVSAKGRNINILQDNYAIESFIQTDAAVNPGNSGGALVDINGRLIGINTAIATPTGTYAGYAFAIPVNLVKKVVADLRDFGSVQRGFLGVTIQNVDQQIAKQNNLDHIYGVYIREVIQGGAAEDAGIRNGDIITHINGIAVNSAPELQEQIARYRPGDVVKVQFIRDGKIHSALVTLKNKNMGTDILTTSNSNSHLLDVLGIEVEELSQDEKSKLGIKNGIRVKKIYNGKIANYTDMREGFIITHVDRKPVDSLKEFIEIIENKSGGVMVEGIYPNYKGKYYYAFGI